MSSDIFTDAESDSFGKLSRINSAGLVNSVLSNLWSDFFRHFRDGKYLSANSDLDCIWTILGGEKGVETDGTQSAYLKVEKRLFDSGALQDSIVITGFGKISEEQKNKFSQHKKILLEKSLFLRRLQNKQGKGTAYDDGEDEDFE